MAVESRITAQIRVSCNDSIVQLPMSFPKIRSGRIRKPAKDVKAYVKRNKNDAADAEAICEAVGRPRMRFVRAKSAEQQGRLILLSQNVAGKYDSESDTWADSRSAARRLKWIAELQIRVNRGLQRMSRR